MDASFSQDIGMESRLSIFLRKTQSGLNCIRFTIISSGRLVLETGSFSVVNRNSKKIDESSAKWQSKILRSQNFAPLQPGQSFTLSVVDNLVENSGSSWPLIFIFCEFSKRLFLSAVFTFRAGDAVESVLLSSFDTGNFTVSKIRFYGCCARFSCSFFSLQENAKIDSELYPSVIIMNEVNGKGFAAVESFHAVYTTVAN